MFVADAGVLFLLIPGLLVLGIFGFFVMVLVLICRVIGGGLAWLFGTNEESKEDAGRAAAVCPHPGCGKANSAKARYCGRCGRVLAKRSDVDLHG